MNGRYLLDTNIVIALFRDERGVRKAIEAAVETFINATVLGELRFGAENSARKSENLLRLSEFQATITILPCDGETATLYAVTRFSLQRQGRPIPENDVWIAASALQYGLTLASRDQHFDAIPNLPRVDWA